MTATPHHSPHSKWTLISQCPVPLAGLALAMASLGNAWEAALPLHGYGRSILGILALCCLLLLTLSALINPRRIHEVLMHPVAGGIIPTFCMGWMVVTRALHDVAPLLMTSLWGIATALHLCALARFTYCRWCARCWQHMAPSWFIPSVGFIVATLSCPDPRYHMLCIGLLGLGMFNLALLMPIMLYRLIMHPPLEASAQPTLAILAAPVSLTLAGYISSVSVPALWLCGLLAGIALLMTAVVYGLLLSLLKRPFSPSFAAFTFPTVISAIALQKLVQLPSLTQWAPALPAFLSVIAHIELGVATAIVGYVSIGFLSQAVHALFKRRLANSPC